MSLDQNNLRSIPQAYNCDSRLHLLPSFEKSWWRFLHGAEWGCLSQQQGHALITSLHTLQSHAIRQTAPIPWPCLYRVWIGKRWRVFAYVFCWPEYPRFFYCLLSFSARKVTQIIKLEWVTVFEVLNTIKNGIQVEAVGMRAQTKSYNLKLRHLPLRCLKVVANRKVDLTQCMFVAIGFDVRILIL